MATVEITASWSGKVHGVATGDYSTAHSTSNSGPTAGVIWAGQRYWSAANQYLVYRGFLVFDTSSLAGETITQVNLRLTVNADYSVDDFDVQIVKQDWSAYDPLTSANRDAAFDACLAGTADSSIWRNTSGISTSTPYDSGNLDTAWVNTAGNTYYSFRSSKDYSNITPTDSEYIQFRGYNDLTATYRPILVVTTEGGGGSSTPIHLIRTGMQPGMRIGL